MPKAKTSREFVKAPKLFLTKNRKEKGFPKEYKRISLGCKEGDASCARSTFPALILDPFNELYLTRNCQYLDLCTWSLGSPELHKVSWLHEKYRLKVWHNQPPCHWFTSVFSFSSQCITELIKIWCINTPAPSLLRWNNSLSAFPHKMKLKLPLACPLQTFFSCTMSPTYLLVYSALPK